MDLDRAKVKLADGYCLWVGAGVTKQLWPGALQWDELTKKLEGLAELAEGQSAHYPERLQSCSVKLGADVFRKHLRKIYYTDLCEAMLRRAAQSLKDENGIAPELRQVAALGLVANPIVSFNIEPFSSTLLARRRAFRLGETLCRCSGRGQHAEARALMKQTGMAFDDAFAQVLQEREKSSDLAEIKSGIGGRNRERKEADARPSDCIAMATQHNAPIYVSGEVWEEVEDMAEVLRKIEEEDYESRESDEDDK